MNDLRKEILQAAQGDIEVAASDAVIGRYLFPSTFIGFSGHFPGYSVLPAFIQVLSALIVVEKWKGHRLQLLTIEKAKFHIELRPNQELTVQCREREVRESAVYEIKLNVAEGLAASFVMRARYS
jgi:3-hydroxymyristoyl/3-hydroxydecanoyl-(acyl carrier protein) dehydratase